MIKNHFHDDLNFINSVKDEFVQQILFWSLENIVPLRELNSTEAIVTSYEDIKSNPRHEVNRIFSYLSLDLPHNLDTKLDKPSRTSWNQGKHKPNIERKIIEESSVVLSYFGLDKLYSGPDSPPPKLAEKSVLESF